MINIEGHILVGMDWYNCAWLYSDRYLGDYLFKQEFIFIRKALGKMPKPKPYIKKDTDTGTNTGNI